MADSPEQRFVARLGRPSSAGALRARVLAREAETLTAAVDRLAADDAVLEAAQLIVGARRRFVLGSGRSSAYAALFAWDLSAGLAQVFHVDDSVLRVVDVLADVRTQDVLVVFSYRRYQSRTLEVAAAFAERGGTVVAVTDEPDAPIAAVARATVAVPTGSVSYAESPTGVATAIHLLTTLATASAKGARRRLAERERASAALVRYVDEEAGR